MCLYFALVAKQSRSIAREKCCRRLMLILLSCLVLAFAILPDYVIAETDNETMQQAATKPVRTQADKFKWKFIICLPVPVDVLPASSGDRRRKGWAGLLSTLGGLTINGLMIAH